MEKESELSTLWLKETLDPSAGQETFDHTTTKPAGRAHLCCRALWSGAGVIHIQGAISQDAAIQPFDCSLGLVSFVISTNANARGSPVSRSTTI